MECYLCHSEIPDDSLFCPDCGADLRNKKEEEDTNSVPKQEESPRPTQEETPANTDEKEREDNPAEKEITGDCFESEGKIYFSLNPKEDTDDISERWIHGNGCGGTIYMGNNAMCVCGRCRKSADLRRWEKTGPATDGVIEVEISDKVQPLSEAMKALPINRADLKWLNETTGSLLAGNPLVNLKLIEICYLNPRRRNRK